MRFVRRASLIFSLTLIVAIAMAYSARRSELADQRDVELTSAAESGAARLSALTDAAGLAAASGDDPAATADALAALDARLGVCVVDRVRVACTGDGAYPPMDFVGEHQAAMRDDVDEGYSVVTVHGTDLTIDVRSDDLAAMVRVPVEVLGGGRVGAVGATTQRPVVAGSFVVEGDVRSTSALANSTGDVYVVAGGPNSIELPESERKIALILFSHAVALLFLAAYTLFTERRHLVERASIDPLTRLPNRSEFERLAAEMLELAERQGIRVCLLLFDLNGFKQVNDTHGHHAGDELLEVVGARLRAAVRGADIVARWGGDEFVVLMPTISDVEMGERRARQLERKVAGPTRLIGSDRLVSVSVSVGVAIWPYHGYELRTLVEAADAAMYFAKRHGVPVSSAPSAGAAPLEPIVI